jgi:hypothetical protein
MARRTGWPLHTRKTSSCHHSMRILNFH